MADPVATVDKIVKLGLAIKEAVDTVRRNEEECRDIRKRVLRFGAILSQLQQAGMMSNNPAMSGALQDLEETLEDALGLVLECQERHIVRRYLGAGNLSRQLRRVKDDILNKVMLASFAINAQATMVLLTIQAGHPPPRQPLVFFRTKSNPEMHEKLSSKQSSFRTCFTMTNVGSELDREKHNMQAGSEVPGASLAGLRKFGLSELKDAMSGGNIIGQGGFCIVYKGALNDGNMVAIKKYSESNGLRWPHIYDRLLLASKLQHKNMVKVLGYGHEIGSSSLVRFLQRKIERNGDCFWVEEYMPNGSLNKIIHESRLDWSSIFRIIQGVSQGMHYLHEQHIVHGDVKPSNILLDSEMNPRITDFGCSRVLDDNEIICDTVIGTFGFLAPEYAMEGILSKKTDVYAFGVTLLRTINSMCRSKAPTNHLGGVYFEWAWEAWEAGRMEEVFDPSFFGVSQLPEIKRCVEVGLLCTQDDRADRPSMADVLEMLNGRGELPTPKKPGYMRSDEEEDGSPSAWSDRSNSP